MSGVKGNRCKKCYYAFCIICRALPALPAGASDVAAVVVAGVG